MNLKMAGSQEGNSTGGSSQEGNPGGVTAPLNCHPTLKSICICTFVLAVIFFISTIGLAIKLAESGSQNTLCLHRDPPCHHDWIWHRGWCYYFSKSDEEKTWNASESFCSDHNATLLVTDSKDIKDFVIRFKGSDNYWIGLQKEDESWMWVNGKQAEVKVLGMGGTCAFLTTATDFEASSSRCGTFHSWICSKPDALPNPKGS